MNVTCPSPVERTRSETDENVVTMRKIEVAVARMMHARLRDERSAAHAAMRMEPRLRIVAIAIGAKAWVGRERISGPLPDRTAAVDQAECGRAFPFSFGWQASPGPATERFRFVRVHMTNRLIRRQRFPAAEPAMLPASSTFAPVVRMGGCRLLEPRAPFVRPPASIGVTPGVDELGKAGVAHARTRHPHRRERYLVRPLLVVEDERTIVARAAHEYATRNVDVGALIRQRRHADRGGARRTGGLPT